MGAERSTDRGAVSALRRALPRRTAAALRLWRRGVTPHWIRFGGLRRLQPVSEDWGLDRGRPIDRYYIEAFLDRNRLDIGGRVLEVGTDAYTRRFGGEQVGRSDVLDPAPGREGTTIVGDLARTETLPEAAFDCVILTQTLQYIHDVGAALRTVERGLKPGGVLLVSVPGISRTEPEKTAHPWQWSFTPSSVRRLLEDVFGAPAVLDVQSHGNVLSAAAFLFGLSDDELRRSELDYRDTRFDIVIVARVVKAGLAATGSNAGAGSGTPQ